MDHGRRARPLILNHSICHAAGIYCRIFFENEQGRQNNELQRELLMQVVVYSNEGC